jgi:hypothetical protein
VWTTSLEKQLLQFAGPAHADSGCLLQRVDLMSLLPPGAKRLYPMEIQAAPQQGADSCLLIVTAHAGAKSKAAVCCLRLAEGRQKGAAPPMPRLVACWQDPKLLKQPNMVAIQ